MSGGAAAAGAAGVAYAGGAVSLSGMAGVAYGGGATSAVPSHFEPGSPPKDPVMERVRAAERVSPQDVGQQRRDVRDVEWDRGADVQRRGSFKRDHIARSPQDVNPNARGESPVGASPSTYHTPAGTPGEHTAAYTQYDRESYIPLPIGRSPTPPAGHSRKTSNATYTESTTRVTPPAVAKLSSQTPPGPAAKAHTPDKSLPVQEEPEEDMAVHAPAPERHIERERWASNEYPDSPHREATTSPIPSSDLHPDGHPARFDQGRNGQKMQEDVSVRTEHHDVHDEDVHDENQRSQDEESYTPRSPVANLPPDRPYASRSSPVRQQVPRHKARNGSTDHTGMRTFDSTVFEQTTVEQLKGPVSQTPDHHAQNGTYPFRHQDSRASNYSLLGNPNGTHPEDMHFAHILDEYYQNFMNSPVSTNSRPGAPIPPTPHSQTAAPSPSPFLSHLRSKPPYSPVPTNGSPYPYPYGHIRRGQSYSGSVNGTVDMSQFDPNLVREQMALQMQMYALNNSGMMTDSTLSPSSTPFPGPSYNPWTFLQTTRMFGGQPQGADSNASIRSSPSHEPVPLPFSSRPHPLRRQQAQPSGLRNQSTIRVKRKPPPRVQSTQPRETSPELSSGEETAGESKAGEETYASEATNWMVDEHDEQVVEGPEDDAEWVDEEWVDGDEDDLLQLEFHTDYVNNPEKRRRRWKSRWEDLIRAFNALDRETDTTMVLLAAPSHSGKLHAVASRALRRDGNMTGSREMAAMRGGFQKLAARRESMRMQVSSLVEQLSQASGTSRDGSPASNASKEEDLRRALGTALGSLSALGDIYERREMRWAEEMARLDEDKERVQMLLRQVLGVPLQDVAGKQA
ncbi:hypothetical protein OF83DRAFT_1071445 [Amylostereum chailletii]|nr:hypothetical protein OF83DRAFT_1071445 [Amylostereum chailletii]